MLRKIASIVVLLLVATLAFLAGSLHQDPRDTLEAATVAGARVLYYHCPMHPSYRSDRPGTAACCGMPLEPVYAGVTPAPVAPGSPGTIKVSPEVQQLIGVRVETVGETAETDHMRLSGRVAADETRVFKLNAGLPGYIRELSLATTGSRVKKGQWLASFSTPDARQSMGAYLQSLDVLDREEKLAAGDVQVSAARANRQLAADRLLTFGMSPVQLEEIARTRQAPSSLKLTSPVDGFVLARNVSLGEAFDAGTEIFRIADLRRVWVLVGVFGADVEDIRPGAPAQISLPGRRLTLPARVSEVPPQFDSTIGTLQIRLLAENPGFVLRPDMFIDVDLHVSFEPTLVVPAEAVLDSGLRRTVFVERGEGLFEPREVEIGWRRGGRVQIVKGLSAGERIATSGTFLLDSESRMKS